MKLEMETGTPTFDGRYVVYVESVFGWLEPHIVIWMKNGWYFLHSPQPYTDPVFFWFGPLPVIDRKTWNMENSPKLEYDL